MMGEHEKRTLRRLRDTAIIVIPIMIIVAILDYFGIINIPK